MILIGSKAIKYWFPDFPREPKDTDYIVDSIPKIKQPITEYLLNPIFENHCNYSSKSLYNSVLEPNYLCTLKASHLCWDIQWDKHMFDLQFLLKKGCKINEGLFWKLYDYWNEVHGKNKRSDLKMSKEDFFDNAINYDSGEHDEIHKLINPTPTYTKVLKDGAEVELDENKFFNLSHEEKLEFVKEEVYVMAFERYKNLHYKQAYGRMLKKFIISHCPKFALIWTLENYVELVNPKKIINYKLIIENGTKNQYQSS